MKLKYRYIFLSLLLFFFSFPLFAQILDDASWKEIAASQDDVWFATEEARTIAENVILYQSDLGGWPKNIQMHLPLSDEERKDIILLKNNFSETTVDNGATTQEMLFLLKMYTCHKETRYRDAFLKGLDYLLSAQYDNGGWPQYFPLRKGYYTHITYNDGAMINIMQLFQKVINDRNRLAIAVPEETIAKLKVSFDKGIDCILKTQYIQDGNLTSWCAQHDEISLEPAKARSYELPSLSGSESVEIVELLMSLDDPSKAVIKAVNAAMKWFELVKISGLREIRTYENGKVIKKVMVKDSMAEPVWTRFMDLEDSLPFFCDRDGVKKKSIEEIGEERRNGYKWYTTEPSRLFQKHAQWLQKHSLSVHSPEAKDSTVQNSKYIVVATDGSGDYISIQKAINSSKSFPYDPITIFIKNGTYREKIKVHEWNSNLRLEGESREGTIITYDDHFKKMEKGRNSTFYTYTLLVEANDIKISNLTIRNTAGEVGQAVALSVHSSRVIVENCNLLGNQDTLYASGNGSQYYKGCYIEGTTDFIFGSATALFENCQIHSKKDSYITAASTPEGATYGYVFKHCTLTANKGIGKVYLGRPWRVHAKTVFIDCNLGSHIRKEGWHNWSKPDAEKTTFYAEYNNIGPGAKDTQRVQWSHQLTTTAAKEYTAEHIFLFQNNSINSTWYESN